MRVAIKFAYDGRNFQGYARQPNLTTVEGEIIKSLVEQRIIDDAKKSLFRSASRTDKGVSALGNVVAFNAYVDANQILEILSGISPSLAAYGKKEVDSDFNPRYAKLRRYRYHLPASNLDTEEIISALPCFTGTHNFSNFSKLESFRDPVRNIESIDFKLEDNLLILDFSAQTFIWHQIRRIISALIKVGKQKISKEQIIEALDNHNKKVDYGLAPAEPLILMDVVYDFDFEYNEILLDKFDLHQQGGAQDS
jgi:tRNA pseudouridine38-40 synthase